MSMMTPWMGQGCAEIITLGDGKGGDALQKPVALKLLQMLL